ncbi:hypothetical protein QR685DRAFT_524171 [Neurospora intermedia]|uniref:Secreted protein n=1 Tax=Neurospora intermedia TaxID=5142 RepID=A0ABR3DD97_NEUIN
MAASSRQVVAFCGSVYVQVVFCWVCMYLPVDGGSLSATIPSIRSTDFFLCRLAIALYQSERESESERRSACGVCFVLDTLKEVNPKRLISTVVA